MTETTYDVVGIGSAIVDVIAHADESFIAEKKLNKGTMALIDADQAEALYAAMGPGVEVSGGSVANSMAGIASLGGDGAFLGKVRDDQLGKVFAHDIRAVGVHYDTAPATGGLPTARCLILVTPDAQRTMNTFLGAATGFGPADLDKAKIEAAKVTYMEGYLFDSDDQKAAFRTAAEWAHAAGRKVAVSLSDPFCVDRHRADFRALVDGHVDILFANEDEIKTLYEVDSFDDALQQVRNQCDVAALTRSAKGSVVVAGDEVHVIDAAPVDKVVDTTGAGDLYAAGFLFGWAHGYGLAKAGKIGALCAAEVISHLGARPEVPLRDLVKKALG
jgi:sugar/nucleoside kinase (ribokinase family)